MTEERRQELLDWARRMGFTDAALVNADCMSFREEFRSACEENRCGKYGQYWTCPPGAGEPAELIAEAQRYDSLLMLDYTHPLEDSFDFEGMSEGSHVHARLTQELADDACTFLTEPYLILGHAACSLCEKCTYPESPCRHPDRAVASLSAYCVFVGETVRNCGMKYYTGDDAVHFFTAVLLREKK